MFKLKSNLINIFLLTSALNLYSSEPKKTTLNQLNSRALEIVENSIQVLPTAKVSLSLTSSTPAISSGSHSTQGVSTDSVTARIETGADQTEKEDEEEKKQVESLTASVETSVAKDNPVSDNKAKINRKNRLPSKEEIEKAKNGIEIELTKKSRAEDYISGKKVKITTATGNPEGIYYCDECKASGFYYICNVRRHLRKHLKEEINIGYRKQPSKEEIEQAKKGIEIELTKKTKAEYYMSGKKVKITTVTGKQDGVYYCEECKKGGFCNGGHVNRHLRFHLMPGINICQKPSADEIKKAKEGIAIKLPDEYGKITIKTATGKPEGVYYCDECKRSGFCNEDNVNTHLEKCLKIKKNKRSINSTEEQSEIKKRCKKTRNDITPNQIEIATIMSTLSEESSPAPKSSDEKKEREEKILSKSASSNGVIDNKTDNLSLELLSTIAATPYCQLVSSNMSGKKCKIQKKKKTKDRNDKEEKEEVELLTVSDEPSAALNNPVSDNKTKKGKKRRKSTPSKKEIEDAKNGIEIELTKKTKAEDYITGKKVKITIATGKLKEVYYCDGCEKAGFYSGHVNRHLRLHLKPGIKIGQKPSADEIKKDKEPKPIKIKKNKRLINRAEEQPNRRKKYKKSDITSNRIEIATIMSTPGITLSEESSPVPKSNDEKREREEKNLSDSSSANSCLSTTSSSSAATPIAIIASGISSAVLSSSNTTSTISKVDPIISLIRLYENVPLDLKTLSELKSEDEAYKKSIEEQYNKFNDDTKKPSEYEKTKYKRNKQMKICMCECGTQTSYNHIHSHIHTYHTSNAGVKCEECLRKPTYVKKLNQHLNEKHKMNIFKYQARQIQRKKILELESDSNSSELFIQPNVPVKQTSPIPTAPIIASFSTEQTSCTESVPAKEAAHKSIYAKVDHGRFGPKLDVVDNRISLKDAKYLLCSGQIDSYLENNIYCFDVLSQGSSIEMQSVIGSTCGRHSYKNAIFSMLQILAARSQNKVEFERYQKDLTTQTGALVLSKTDNLTPAAAVLFEQIDEKLREFRGPQRGADLGEAKMPVEEVRYLIANTQAMLKQINVKTEINPAMITPIANIDELIESGSKDINEIVGITKEIMSAKNPDYIGTFILGVRTGATNLPDHWISVATFNKNGKLYYFLMDSLGSRNYSEVMKLKKFIEDGNCDNLIKNAIYQFNEDKNGLDKLIGNFQLGRINSEQTPRFATNSKIIASYNSFIKNLNQLFFHAKKLLSLNLKTNIEESIEKILLNLKNIPMSLFPINIDQINELWKSYNSSDAKSIDEILTKLIIEDTQKNELFQKLEKELKDILSSTGITNHMVRANINLSIDQTTNMTLLMMAACDGKLDLAKLCLDLGASPYLETRNNDLMQSNNAAEWTAMDYAKKAYPQKLDHQEIANLIYAHAVFSEGDRIDCIRNNKRVTNTDDILKQDINVIFRDSVNSGLSKLVKMLLTYQPDLMKNYNDIINPLQEKAKAFKEKSDKEKNIYQETFDVLENAKAKIEREKVEAARKAKEDAKKKAEEKKKQEEKTPAERQVAELIKRAEEAKAKAEQERKIREAKLEQEAKDRDKKIEETINNGITDELELTTHIEILQDVLNNPHELNAYTILSPLSTAASSSSADNLLSPRFGLSEPFENTSIGTPTGTGIRAYDSSPEITADPVANIPNDITMELEESEYADVGDPSSVTSSASSDVALSIGSTSSISSSVESSSTSSSAQKERRKLQCKFCSVALINSKHRREHLELKHHDQFKETCPICGKKFLDKPNLKTHMTQRH